MLLEPSKAWQKEQHQQVIQEDSTAFAKLCERVLPHLSTFLQKLFSHSEHHLSEQVPIDCLMAYDAQPCRYKPERLSLLAKLCSWHESYCIGTVCATGTSGEAKYW